MKRLLPLISIALLLSSCQKDEDIVAVDSASVTLTTVFEYMPAPGQYINTDEDYASMDEACSAALERLSSGYYVSLGGFGGYIVVGFDHSIENTGGYNIGILGNSFETSSEPGVVWVMQDSNSDGLPNDTWYELKGSEYGAEGTVSDYEVTYYRPSGAGTDTPWTDNQGGSGVICYISAYHRQDYYYPSWIEEDSYTLVGTRLESKSYLDGDSWVCPAYDWGYADNYSSIDMYGSVDSYANMQTNMFKISDAVKADGSEANLDFVDFVKVQGAINASSGSLGETSTEVCGFVDLNMIENQ